MWDCIMADQLDQVLPLSNREERMPNISTCRSCQKGRGWIQPLREEYSSISCSECATDQDGPTKAWWRQWDWRQPWGKIKHSTMLVAGFCSATLSYKGIDRWEIKHSTMLVAGFCSATRRLCLLPRTWLSTLIFSTLKASALTPVVHSVAD